MPSEDKTVAILADIYDTYRTALLNKFYCGQMLARFQKVNTWFDIAIAVGTTSTGVSGLALWKYEPVGPVVWSCIAFVAAMFAVSKPFLQFNKKVERYTMLYTEHLNNSLTLAALISKIKREQGLSEENSVRLQTPDSTFWWPPKAIKKAEAVPGLQ
jgi:hypothetical protein